jgi:hypothetical protein
MHGHASKKITYRENAVLWNDFESDVVEGRYPLGRLVRSEGRCGWFETQYDEKPAIISLFESLNDEAVLLERLRAVEKVSDKNVVKIFEAGATRVRDTPLVYAVMEYAEENLEDVLRARALSAEETKDVAEGLLNALAAIHKERLVCGRLEAASVLAAGDTIKLRSDYLQLAPKDAPFETYAAKDVRDLGSVLHQCLTQKPLKRATDGNDPSLQLLPAPFVQIVRRTLSGQATLDEIAAILRPGAVPAPVPAQAQTKPAAAPASVPASRPAQDVAAIKPPAPVAEMEPSREGPPRRTALIVGGVVVLLLLAGLALRAMLHHSDSTQDAAAQNPVVVVSPETTTPRKPPPVVPPPAAKPKASAAAPVAAPVRTTPDATSPAGTWRVVAFTYNYQNQAEHKAQTINERHPDLDASVFSPKGSGAPFLVALGPATDRASAIRLRDKAVEEGLPRDTYAQNYSH